MRSVSATAIWQRLLIKSITQDRIKLLRSIVPHALEE